MFINYSRESGVFVASYRLAGAYAGDLADVMQAVQKDGAAVCCDLDGAKDALCDGEWLGKISADEETVETVYNAILQAEEQA